jgi:hypothetical protein
VRAIGPASITKGESLLAPSPHVLKNIAIQKGSQKSVVEASFGVMPCANAVSINQFNVLLAHARQVN